MTNIELRDCEPAEIRIPKLIEDLMRERDEYKLGHDRYEKLRKLNPRGYSELWNRALTGEKRFDELVDEL